MEYRVHGVRGHSGLQGCREGTKELEVGDDQVQGRSTRRPDPDQDPNPGPDPEPNPDPKPEISPTLTVILSLSLS